MGDITETLVTVFSDKTRVEHTTQNSAGTESETEITKIKTDGIQGTTAGVSSLKKLFKKETQLVSEPSIRLGRQPNMATNGLEMD